MNPTIRIGTRESELAVWQAKLVQDLLAQKGHDSTLVYIKSEGDIDLKTPLYEMGVQGIFTRSLDIALLNGNIDVAVHSLKDVPTQLPPGISQVAVLERGNNKDLFVFNGSPGEMHSQSATGDFFLQPGFAIATSSIRRKAQWLHKFPKTRIDNIRGNVNTRLRKLKESDWQGAIFAAAGLERIGLRPSNAVELDWMLPAPAQGAIQVSCRTNDEVTFTIARKINHSETETCTAIERGFLRELLGGCSTPISALATIKEGTIRFNGNILSLDGSAKIEVEGSVQLHAAEGFGKKMAQELLNNGGLEIAEAIRNGK